MDKDSIPNNSGSVINENGQKVAMFKDNSGNVIKLSAVCTHLGCTVNWNQGDETWDCPCHGSRFNKDGSVLNGPATQPLPKI